jgi:tetratricopeptide (TPR) repeat protein
VRLTAGKTSAVAWLGACCALALTPVLAAKPEVDKLSPTVVRDLHFGDALFYYYQGLDFDTITRLQAYRQWERMPHHDAETDLLLGGLYLALGLHNEAGERFETVLTQSVPEGVRNRAWFYLGKVWYARGYLDRAERAIKEVQGRLTPDLEAERMHLLSNILMRQQRFDEAIALLNSWRGRRDQSDWLAYAQYNLGVALVRKGLVTEADPFLTTVGTLESGRRELRSLRDRANLALGYAYLQNNQPELAKPVLERVRIDGPFSNKALLGVGWADAAAGQFQQALTPWLELRDRNLLDSAVQEAYLAIPYAFAKLNANAQAAENYEVAIRSFDSETVNIDASIEEINNGTMLDKLLQRDERDRYGWFWQLRELPNAPQSRYLYHLLAGHDFQEGLKNYRDLSFLGGTLARWQDSIVAFDDMLATRERAYAERVPQADAVLNSGRLDRYGAGRADAGGKLDQVEMSQDVSALGTAQERDQWARIVRLEAALLTAPDDEETNVIREKTRLAKGVLYWRLAESFKARVWNERRTLKDLDQALREAQNRWVRVQKARSSMPNNTGEFAARVAALRQRLEAAQQRLAGVARKQNGLLESLAREELIAQKERIGTYQIQARFALASIYDRAALGGGNVSAPAEGATESQGELEVLPPDAAGPAGESAPADAPPADATPPSDATPPTDAPPPGSAPQGEPVPPTTPPGTDLSGAADAAQMEPGVDTSADADQPAPGTPR